MITLADCKIQCSLLPEENQHDDWFEMNLSAILLVLEGLVNRKIYANQADLDADLDAPLTAIVFNSSLKLGGLMLVAHWFENRETSSPLSLSETPMALEYLVMPYRLINI